MSLTMATPKKKRPESQDQPISYRPSKDVKAALEDYRAKFEFKPDRTAVIEKALRAFLAAKGYKLADPGE
jgi:hypothetical protein